MEREAFFSGYCRQMDQSRMVAAEAEGNQLIETDCLFDACPYGSECTIHQKIGEFLEED